uniref:Uncharacterized protein n=1 Tax=Urocitellus parryii TaxID=9999 RepID=A0A8D2GXU7_UROPR
MATSGLPPKMLKLKQFMRRQQVLRLSRRILQKIWQVSNVSDHKYLKNWAKKNSKEMKVPPKRNNSDHNCSRHSAAKRVRKNTIALS